MPGEEGDAAWQLAMRPKLPLRSLSGDEVEEPAWKSEQKATSTAFWTTPISASAAGALPTYRIPKLAQHAADLPEDTAKSLTRRSRQTIGSAHGATMRAIW